MKLFTILLTSAFSALYVAVSSAVETAEASSSAVEAANLPQKVSCPTGPDAPHPILRSVYTEMRDYYFFAYAAYSDNCVKEKYNPATRQPWVASVGVHDVRYRFNNGTTDTQGFIAIDHTKKEFVVAFRGSSTFYDFKVDFDRKLLRYPSTITLTVPNGVQVHQGFMDAYASVSGGIYAHINSYPTGDYSDYTIVTVGHSLGGSLASLAAVSLKARFARAGRNVNAKIYSYGQMRVGNPTYANWVESTIGVSNIYRMVNAGDIAPHYPPLSYGYRHHGTEYWTCGIHSELETVKCTQPEQPNCSLNAYATDPTLGVGPHRDYFGWASNREFCKLHQN